MLRFFRPLFQPIQARHHFQTAQSRVSQEALEVKKLSDPLTAFFEYFYTTEQINGLFIGVANMGIDRIRTHLYPAYLAYTRAMNISELGLELSNQVQRFFEVNFIRCFPTQTFTRS